MKGVSLYCFRCGDKDFVADSDHSLADLVAARQQALAEAVDTRVKLILEPLSNAPDAALVWLLSGGLLPEEAEHVHGIKWHAATNRLMIPIRNAAQVQTAVLARAVNNERPKYRLVRGDATLHFPNKLDYSQATIVVVEDVLSSIAVARAGYNSVAILGTSISDTDALAITRGMSTVVAFMDPDKAGIRGAVALRKKLALYPVKFVTVRAGRDPKYLPREQLREKIDAQIRRVHA